MQNKQNDINEQIEYKLIDFLTNNNYINGVTAVETARGFSKEVSPLIQKEREEIRIKVKDMLLSKFDFGCDNCWENIESEKQRMIRQVDEYLSQTKGGTDD